MTNKYFNLHSRLNKYFIAFLIVMGFTIFFHYLFYIYPSDFFIIILEILFFLIAIISIFILMVYKDGQKRIITIPTKYLKWKKIKWKKQQS